MIFKLEPQFVIKPWGVEKSEKYTGINGPGKIGEIWTASAMKKKDDVDGAGPNVIEGFGDLSDVGDIGDVNFSKKGKAECWYFREVIGNVEVVTGLKVTKEEFIRLIDNDFENKRFDDLRDILKIEKAKKGDAFIIEPGTVHTIQPNGGIAIIDELQDSFGNNTLPTTSKILLVSDLLSLQVHPLIERMGEEMKIRLYEEPTLRIHDFGRKRRCYVKESIDLIEYDKCAKKVDKIKTDSFIKDFIDVKGKKTIKHKNHYYVYSILDGSATVKGDKFVKGDTFFVDASTKSLELDGNASIMRDYPR